MPRISSGRRVAAVPLLALALAGCQPPVAGGAERAPASPSDEVSEPRTLAASAPSEIELGREPVTVAIPLSASANERIAAVAGPGRLRLIVEGLRLLRPGGSYQVYLNLPAGAEPDPGGPHFLGLVAPFASPGHTGAMSRGFDVTAVVGPLRDRGLWEETLRVTFVPDEDAQPTVPGPYLRLRRVALVER